MKKLIFLMIMTTTATFAQQSNLIQVSGMAEIDVQPDTAVLNIQVNENEQSMSEAMKALDKKTAFYVDMLTDLGFEEDDIKTTQFSVRKHREYEKNRYVDKGFIASQSVQIEFIFDKDRLTKLLTALSNSQEEINFSLGFKLSDELRDNTQAKAIAAAVADATNKASLLANSANVKLGSLHRVSYGSSMNNQPRTDLLMETRAVAMAGDQAETSFNFTPKDISFRETVLMEWFIAD